MSKKIIQYNAGKDYLYYYYRFVILPWELEWSQEKFIKKKGSLDSYCKNKNISIKSFASAEKLKYALTHEYQNIENSFNGVLWFVRSDTVPKDILRHLRNCFAHGNFQMRQKNKIKCIFIKNINSNTIKAQGFIPVDEIRGLVESAKTCLC